MEVRSTGSEFRADGDFAEIVRSVSEALPTSQRALVAIDGIGGSGKTVFADQLARALAPRPTLVLHADDFFNEASVRHAQGRYSPEGFWRDTYNYAALTEWALRPLAPSGDGSFRRRSIDSTTGIAVQPPAEQATADTVAIVEGTFLHREELREHWDFSVYLDVSFAVAALRMAARTGTEVAPVLRERYEGAQRLYFAAAQPAQAASLVVDNSVLGAPQIAIGRNPHARSQPE